MSRNLKAYLATLVTSGVILILVTSVVCLSMFGSG